MSANRASSRLQALINHIQCSYSAPTNPNILDKPVVLRKIAAVLICVFEGGDGSLRFRLTVTSAGEVALPGGKREEGDADDVQTALREAKEEIGLDPSLVSVITPLQPFHTTYGVTIVPVLGVLTNKDAFSPILNSAEVEEIFDVPLEIFLKRFPDFLEQRPAIWGGMTEGDKIILQNISKSK
ncbi:hypothetical protein ACSQ67_012984 [Phaseolus vulgaris]